MSGTAQKLRNPTFGLKLGLFLLQQKVGHTSVRLEDILDEVQSVTKLRETLANEEN